MTTGWDKSNHLLAFGVMMLLGCKAYAQRVPSILIGLLAYGAVIEIAQSYTPNRSAEWLDFLADGIGILLGWAVWWVTSIFRPVALKTDSQRRLATVAPSSRASTEPSVTPE